MKHAVYLPRHRPSNLLSRLLRALRRPRPSAFPAFPVFCDRELPDAWQPSTHR